jgi:hypothetical protein
MTVTAVTAQAPQNNRTSQNPQTLQNTQAPVRPADADAAGRQVEEILDRLEAAAGPASRGVGDELVRALMRFYGAGLARVLELVTAAGAAASREALLADSRVAALLTLHDLHPDDLPARVERALAAVPGRPFELAALDEAAASVTLLRSGSAASSGCGCGSAPDGGQEAVETALACFAPEIGKVEVSAPSPQAPLLQIGLRPGATAGAAR